MIGLAVGIDEITFLRHNVSLFFRFIL